MATDWTTMPREAFDTEAEASQLAMLPTPDPYGTLDILDHVDEQPTTTRRDIDRSYAARKEQQRHRSQTKLDGIRADEVVNGHPVLFGTPQPAFELARMPQGGGYPQGLIEYAGRLMGVTDHRQVVRLCSGSVRAPLTFDLRPDSEAAVICDVRHLPIADASVRWIMCDPPYSADHADALWGTGKQYPAPAAIMREAARILKPGGTIAFLHFVVPRLPAALERVGTYGVTIGPGYRIRALTIARRLPDEHPTLLEVQ